MSQTSSKPAVVRTESAKTLIANTLKRLGVQLSASTPSEKPPISVYIGKQWNTNVDPPVKEKKFSHFLCTIDGIKSAIMCLRALPKDKVLFYSITYMPYDSKGNAIPTQFEDLELLTSLTEGLGVDRKGLAKLPFKGFESEDASVDGNFRFLVKQDLLDEEVNAIA